MKNRTKIGNELMGTPAVVAARLVTREEARTRSRMLAYRAVATKVGRSADWVRRLIREGAQVSADMRDRLDEMLVRGLETDIARLQAELALARQSGSHAASKHVGEIEAHLAKATALLNGGAK